MRSKRSAAPTSPDTSPRGMAGSATDSARSFVVSLASLIASASAACRLSCTATATTTTSTTTPAARSWATGFLTYRTQVLLYLDRTCAQYDERRSEVEGSATYLAIAHVVRPPDDAVHTGPVQDRATHGERTARREGGARALRGHGAVVHDAPGPRLADAVAVDLALDLETAVLRSDLQLPVAGTAARAGANLVRALRLRRSGNRHARCGGDENGSAGLEVKLHGVAP